MQSRILIAIVSLLLGAICFAADAPKSDKAEEGWKVASSSGEVKIWSRRHPGSPLKEFKAIGQVDAPSRTVYGVIGDFESYTSFMPYLAECRLLKRESGSYLTYQRISPKICGDRDYTLRIHETSSAGDGGLIYSNKWEPANESGPPEKKGVLRVKVCEGSWLLEPDGAEKTRATYCIYSDTRGLIPAFIANHFAQVAIGKLFAAIRKQAKEPKYSVIQR
jgi:ribosome-associated toxin RatA of RatAB toxin-antitoxin module